MAKQKYSFFTRLFDHKMWFYDFVKFTGCLPVIVDLRIKKIIFAKNKKRLLSGKYIISSNHMSYSDPIIVSNAFWTRRVGFVATQELFQKKIWDIAFRGFGCIPVDKDNPTLQTFKAVKERLERGHIVCVFPEGQVRRDENIQAFKSGVVMMAIMADADILPVYLVKRKKRIHRQKVVIGDKINYKEYVKGPIATMEEIENITRVLQTREKELEDKYLEMIKEKKK